MYDVVYSNIDDYYNDLEKQRNLLEYRFNEYFPNKYHQFEVNLSVKAQMLIQGINLPCAVFNLGPPGSFKTTILDIIGGLPDSYTSDSFTPKAIVSHSANTSSKNLKKIDLLPKIKDSVFITPELGSLFSGDVENVTETFGVLTRVLDGNGYSSDSGVHGNRGYRGKYFFVWLGAVVEIPSRIWRILGNLGPKLYFLRMTDDDSSWDDKRTKIITNLQENNHHEKVTTLKNETASLWSILLRNPALQHGKIEWNTNKDDKDTLKLIVDIAGMLANLRATLPISNTSDSNRGGANYYVETPIKEDPGRASQILYNIARGHAVLYGRNYITQDELSSVISVAFSSCPKQRMDLFRWLIECDGEITTDEFMNLAKVSRATALKDLYSFKRLGIVDVSKRDSDTKPVFSFKLKDKYKWFLTDEFQDNWQFTRISHRDESSKFSKQEDNKKGVPENNNGETTSNGNSKRVMI